MSRKLGKRAMAAAAAAEAAMMATAVRMEQQEQSRLSFFRRSLERNDVEIAALQDLHLTIQIAKRHLLRSCSQQQHDDYDDDYYYHSPDDDEEDCLLLLDLGQGKIRLTADKEGLEDANHGTTSTVNDPNCNTNSKSLVAKLSPESYHWSYDFLLRLQLRRQLLNRLMRRLQRTAVVMDASAAADINDNKNDNGNGNNNINNNSNKGDAAAMAALVQPPLPPKYGDLRLHMDAREIQEFQLHWERQEQARIQIELQRESFYAKQAHALQELDKSLVVEASAAETATATAAAINNPTRLHPKETISISNSAGKGAGAPEEAADGDTAVTGTATTDDTTAVKQPAADEMEVDNDGDKEVPTATQETANAATSDSIGNVVDEEAKVDTVDTAKLQETVANDTPMAEAANDEDSHKTEQEQQQQPAAVSIPPPPSPPLAPVSSTTAATTAVATDDNDNDGAKVVADADADDELEIDYEAYREYMNAYEKIIHPTTGQVQYTLLAEDDDAADAQTTPNNKAGKNKKKKNMPDFSTFILPGIGATVHRTMSTQEKEAEYERWSAALLARIPQQPTMAELGLEHQVFYAKQRRRRAKQRRLERAAKLKAAAAAAAAAAKEASTATTTAAVTLPFISPGKKLRNKLVEEDDANMKDEDNDDDDIDAPGTAPPSVSQGKTLRNKLEDDEDSKKDDDNDEQEAGDAKKDVDDDSKIARDDDNNGMDVDVADNQGKETEVKDDKEDAANVADDRKEKQESEDEQEKDVSSDEEEQSDEDNEESQQTKDNEEKEGSPSKKAAAPDEKPAEDEEEDDDDDDDKPPTNQKKRPIILAPTPSFYEQDLKRVKLVHAEIMRSSMADHGRRKIKDATQEYNAALQVSSELYARQKQLHAQLHAFTADTRNEVAKMQNQYEVDLAVARSQWNRRRIDFEQKKLQRLMPERNNPNYRAEGTPMTKMYETQQDPVKQIVSSTVAHIVDTVELIDTCRLQNDRFTEEFRPPPPSADSALTKNGQVEASIRQEIANLAMQLRSSEEDRQRAWKRMLKIKTEFSGVFGPSLEVGPTSHPHYQQQQLQQPQQHPSMPLPNLHQSSRQSFPQEAAVASYNLPSFAPARAPRHPVRRPSIAPLSSTAPTVYNSAADLAGSDSKYSAARVRERISSDGTVAPVTTPKKTKEGLYQRPAGRTRKGMEWDAVRGIWVPADQQTTLVQLQPDMIAWQHPPQG